MTLNAWCRQAEGAEIDAAGNTVSMSALKSMMRAAWLCLNYRGKAELALPSFSFALVPIADI